MFFLKSLMPSKAAFIYYKIQLNSNIVKYYYNLKQLFYIWILQYNLCLWWKAEF